jgi:hypothetical protein
LGIIKGRVTAGPTCPVERAENPCPPAPIANRAVQIRDQSGNSVILTLTTDSQGYFQGQLAAGTYLLTIMSSGALPRDSNGPHRVTVNAGQTANVDIRLDTGIR